MRCFDIFHNSKHFIRAFSTSQLVFKLGCGLSATFVRQFLPSTVTLQLLTTSERTPTTTSTQQNTFLPSLNKVCLYIDPGDLSVHFYRGELRF